MSTDLAHRLRVGKVVRETHDSVSVHFTLAPNQRSAFGYKPGQFLTLRLPTAEGNMISRCYSLASAPGLDDDLVVTVKRVHGGPGSNWLCDLADRMETEDEPIDIDSLPPTGMFTPKDLDTDLLLVAGGSGVTPVMSILRSALEHGTGTLTVLYANRDEKSVIFAEELTELAKAHPDRLVVHHWIESVQGLPTVQTVGALVGRSTFTEAFICGPTPFMHCVRDALKEAGYDRKAIHLEKFNSLAGDPFDGVEPAPPADHENAEAPKTDGPEVEQAEAPVPAPTPPAGATETAAPETEPDAETSESSEEGGTDGVPSAEESETAETETSGETVEVTEDAKAEADAKVIVDFDGETHEFDWPAGTLLLDVLKSNGIKVPSSCGEGVCGACECQKTDGEIEMLQNYVLEDEDIEEGYVLACQSVPRSPVVKITYEEY